MTGQRLHDDFRRRPDREGQRGAVGNAAGNRLGNGAFLWQVEDLPPGVVEIADRGGRLDAAMGAAQDAVLAQPGQVAADRLGRHLEPLGQRLDGGEAVRLHEIGDLALARGDVDVACHDRRCSSRMRTFRLYFVHMNIAQRSYEHTMTEFT